MRLQGEPPVLTKEEIELEGGRLIESSLTGCAYQWLGFIYRFALEEIDGRLEWVCLSAD